MSVRPWICFHCGFETVDEKEAAAHFGDRDDPEECKPLCRWWASMTPVERGEQLQDVIQQLNQEQDENARYSARIQELERELEVLRLKN